MKAVVLLSAGRHPVSGKPVLPRLEAQAIALAAGIKGQTSGLHAGAGTTGVADALGHGLERIDWLAIAADADPVPALAAHLRDVRPDLIFAGRRGQGGEDTGLLPYALADALGLPILADVVASGPANEPGAMRFDQALPKGAKRRVTMRLPALVTMHPLAPAPMPYAFARARRGVLCRKDGVSIVPPPTSFEERPHRARPKLMRRAGAASEDGAGVIVDPGPEEAARLILDHLEKLGIRRFSRHAAETEWEPPPS
ncbi:electron transfer flavoprotein subunit beta [Consotaella aegiceratis]|uniref:electron transfer flavoprotein subunit beta n=1 Tax=Consotaella aegiceratis TaxID=3097961 RepID=UPI002F418E20